MSPTTQQICHLTLHEAYRKIRSGDVLLFRPRRLSFWQSLWPLNWFGFLICIFGRSEYCHAGMVVRVRHMLMVAEMVEGQGGRLYPLSRYLRTNSGSIDVYHINQDYYDPSAAAAAALDFSGAPYGYRSVLYSTLLHLPIIRGVVHHFCFDRQTDDELAPTRPMYCSAAVAWAMRTGGGVDPVNQQADSYTEPGDLARSATLDYQFTLVEDEPAVTENQRAS